MTAGTSNTQHLDVDELREQIRAVYDLSLDAFKDRCFAEAALMARYLADEDSFDRNKPLVERQIGRKIKLTEPLGQANIVDAWKTMARYMPRPPTENYARGSRR